MVPSLAAFTRWVYKTFPFVARSRGKQWSRGCVTISLFVWSRKCSKSYDLTWRQLKKQGIKFWRYTTSYRLKPIKCIKQWCYIDFFHFCWLYINGKTNAFHFVFIALFVILKLVSKKSAKLFTIHWTRQDTNFKSERLNNCKGPHMISATTVGSARDLISQKKMYKVNV